MLRGPEPLVAGCSVRPGNQCGLVVYLHRSHINKHHAAPNHNVGASNHHHFDIFYLYYQHVHYYYVNDFYVDYYHVNNNNGSANDNDNTATANHHVPSGDNDNLCRPHRSVLHFHDSAHHRTRSFHHHIFDLHNGSGYNNDDNRTTNVYDC